MNKANYGSVEACQRLLSANILLVTDMVWAAKDGCEPQLIPTEDVGKIGGLTIIPAVNFAEVWRELPEETYMSKRAYGYSFHIYNSILKLNSSFYLGMQPIDAAINLLIWITEQKRKENV